MYDLLMRHGRIIDGTGSPRMRRMSESQTATSWPSAGWGMRRPRPSTPPRGWFALASSTCIPIAMCRSFLIRRLKARYGRVSR
jgi:hypothetical protein